MKKIIAVLTIILSMLTCMTVYNYSANDVQEAEQTTTGKLIEIKEKELNTLEDYKEAYGSDAYGLTAFLLNKIRIFSIPFGFVTIVIAGIYQYIIGIRKLDVRDKGFALMISSITLVVICQVLPLVFAIVVRGWRS